MRRFFKVLKDEKGVGVVEIILILVENLALYIACLLECWQRRMVYGNLLVI